MTISISALAFAFVAIVCLLIATKIYLVARANIGVNSESEELAKAHAIVMQLAQLYQLNDKSIEKYHKLNHLRAQVIAYHDNAVGKPVENDSSAASNVVFSFDRAKYKAND